MNNIVDKTHLFHYVQECPVMILLMCILCVFYDIIDVYFRSKFITFYYQ